MLNRFLLEMDGEGKAASTLRSYRYIVGRWVSSPYPDPVEYLGHLDGQLASSTKRHHGRILKGYLRWAFAHGFESENPLASIRFPAPVPPSIRPFSGAEIDALLGVCRNHIERAVILCLLNLGLRASELAGIEAQDLAEDTLTIRSGKGGKTRMLAIGPLSGPLNAIIAASLTYQDIYRVVKRLGVRAGVSDCHPHRFRHSFADACHQSGMSDSDLMTLAGWSSLAMLRRYTAFHQAERAIAAHRRFLENAAA